MTPPWHRSWWLFGVLLASGAAGGQGAGPVAEPARGNVHCAAGRLSLDVRDEALTDLLPRVGSACGLRVVIVGSVDERVTERLDAVEIHRALRTLLRNQDYVIEVAGAGNPGMTVRLIGAGRTPAPSAVSAPAARPDDVLAAADLQALGRAIASVDRDARIDAVHALGLSGDPSAVAMLAPLLSDADDEVREAAFLAMADLSGDAAARALAGALGDSRVGVRIAAVDALSLMDQPGIAALLGPALVDADEGVRELAFSALGGRTGAIDALGPALGDRRPEVRLAAVEALAYAEDARAAALLKRALSDPDEAIRTAAAEVLESIGTKARRTD